MKELTRDQTNEGEVMVDLNKLVTFIAGVVNATIEIKSKNIKAAAHHLQ